MTTGRNVTAMPVSLPELCDELLAESDDLDGLLAPLDEAGWGAMTPAEGWTVRDQVSHLAYFDDAATLALTEPGVFLKRRSTGTGAGSMVEDAVAAHRHRSGVEVHAWLRRSRAALVTAARPMAPATRVPWYGPDMSVASALTARIMETWAHAQDVADALGARRQPTRRLRHVAFIGARAMPSSFRAHGLDVPEVPVRVELRGPDGELWAFGAEEADDVVRGSALDFCLVATQRRHLDDTSLELVGPVASTWLPIAQAFAGPPGAGRRPGQFLPGSQ